MPTRIDFDPLNIAALVSIEIVDGEERGSAPRPAVLLKTRECIQALLQIRIKQSVRRLISSSSLQTLSLLWSVY